MFTSRVVKRVETQTEGVTRKGENKHNSDSRERGPGPHSPAFVLQESIGEERSRRCSTNLSPGGPGGQIGNPIHSFFSLVPFVS